MFLYDIFIIYVDGVGWDVEHDCGELCTVCVGVFCENVCDGASALLLL